MWRKEGKLNIYLIYWHPTHTLCPFCWSHTVFHRLCSAVIFCIFPFFVTYFSNFARNSISLKSIPYQNNNEWEKFAVYENKKMEIRKSALKSLWNPFSFDQSEITVRVIDFGPFSLVSARPEVWGCGSENHIRFAHMLPVIHSCSILILCEKLFSPFSRPSSATLLSNLWEMKWKYFQVLFLTVSNSFSTCSLWLSKLINFS